MSRFSLNCGYVPLVDSAPLIIAKELGFAADEGIDLNLLKQPSWAALRDLLSLGHLEVAHMLAPMPVAMSLGLSGQKTQIDAPLVLSVNGTVLGASTRVTDKMRQMGWTADSSDPANIIKAVTKTQKDPYRVGVPFPYSMHRLLFEYLIGATQGVARDRFTVITMPPSSMAEAVARGELDLFCVGEPWGSVAVQSGQAELLLPGAAIWAHAPEKVVGMRRDWADENPASQAAIVRAIYRASQWLGQDRNRSLASDILAKSEHLGLPEHAIDPALHGIISPALGAEPWTLKNFLKFHSEATTFPWRSLGAWIGHRIAELDHIDPAIAMNVGSSCFRPDLYRRYLQHSGADMPGASSKIEGALREETAVASTRGEMILGPDAFFDDKTFDFGPL